MVNNALASGVIQFISGMAPGFQLIVTAECGGFYKVASSSRRLSQVRMVQGFASSHLGRQMYEVGFQNVLLQASSVTLTSRFVGATTFPAFTPQTSQEVSDPLKWILTKPKL